MGSIGVILVYRPTGGKTVPLANVRNPAVVEAAACEAILAAEKRATEAGRHDEGLGTIARAGARRLVDILTAFVPEIAPSQAPRRAKKR